MDYVQPSFAENVCDSTREEEIVVFCGIAISAIFIKKVTRLTCTYYILTTRYYLLGYYLLDYPKLHDTYNEL